MMAATVSPEDVADAPELLVLASLDATLVALRVAAYSDVIRSRFRRHSIAVPTASDQGSGAFDRRFRSFDHRFRSFDHDRPSG